MIHKLISRNIIDKIEIKRDSLITYEPLGLRARQAILISIYIVTD